MEALAGIRILECAVWQAGPGGTMLLSDLGADVIKIEAPGAGDPMRGLVAVGGMDIMKPGDTTSPAFEIPNRNKRSIAVDLATPEGREIVYRLIPKCDVFVQNFRPGVLASKLQLGYDTLSTYNPRLIYVNVYGYGPKGPDRRSRVQDFVAMARAGLLSTVSPTDQVEPNSSGVADQVTSIMTAYAILVGIIARDRLGIGQEIDVSLLASTMSLQHFALMVALLAGKEPPKRGRKEASNPLYNSYRCSDNKWLCLGVVASDVVWPDVCKALGLENLEKDSRFDGFRKREENCRELIAILEKVFAAKTRDEWLGVLGKYHRIMCCPANRLLDLPADPQVIENQYIIDFKHDTLGTIKVPNHPVAFSKTPGRIKSGAPGLGQHTEQVLVDLAGYTWEQIEAMKKKGVI